MTHRRTSPTRCFPPSTRPVPRLSWPSRTRVATVSTCDCKVTTRRSSSMSRDTDPAADVGLLSPVWAGTAAEAMTSDIQVVGAMARFEVAVSNALADHGLADPVSIDGSDIDVRRLALDAVPPGNP